MMSGAIQQISLSELHHSLYYDDEHRQFGKTVHC